MLIPLGILASSGGGVAGSFDLISTTILGSSQASVTFDVSTLASTYKHLQIRYVTRNSNSDVWGNVNMRFNSDSGVNYVKHSLRGNGSSVTSGANLSKTSIELEGAGNGGATSAFGVGVIDLLDVFSSTKNKTARALWGRPISGDTSIELASGLWLSTSAVTSVTLVAGSVNFLTGSRFSLYGIKG